MRILLRLWGFLPLFLLPLLACACAASAPDEPAAAGAGHEEVEAIARTEFTDRIENFFEYEPLHAGKPSQFLIHLTDLSDGAPVEKAEVSMTVRPNGGSETVLQTTAKVGRVTGIYVAEVTLPRSGEYDIEFRVKNTKLDERMTLSNFQVE